MSSTETQLINSLGAASDIIATATTSPFVSEIKKCGILAMLLSGAQITSCSVFVNSIPAQNMYEGVRFWAIFVFYDVPAWEQNSKIPNHFVSAEIYDLTKEQRRLFDLTQVHWRFARTGQSSFFLYDAYVPVFIIALCWVGALIAHVLKTRYGYKFSAAVEAQCCTLWHKAHEMVMLYVTMAMMLEWLFFDAASFERWFSLFVCLAFSFYFIAYELYVYYEMMRYPEAVIGSVRYEHYLTRYSVFLKNLRFEEYPASEEWSVRHWLRPYNYHVLGYYKKFCMIISLPLFYEVKHAQPLVLALIQLMEIARFTATWPFHATWRNRVRLALEITLFLFFLVLEINSWII